MGRKYTIGMVLRQLNNELRLIWNDMVLKLRSEKKAFVVTEPRTGSNLLLDYLDCHPDISVSEEVLNPWATIGFPKNRLLRPFALHHVKRSLSLDGKIACCKLMLHHLRYHNISYEQLMENFPHAFVIILYRRDLLAQYVSIQRLEETGVHKILKGKEIYNLPKITIDIEKLLAWTEATKKKYTDLMESDFSQKAVVLAYEDLVEKPEVIMSMLFSKMGLTNIPIKTRMVKQGADGLSKAIVNYDEVMATIDSNQIKMFFPPKENS